MAAAVEVGAEADAFVGHLAELAERKDLKAAGIGEQGARPTDEAMQAAHAADGFVARTEIEVVCVAEDDLDAEGFEQILRDGFDGTGGAYGHENGGFNSLVGQDELGAAATGLGLIEEVELERH